MSDPIPPTEPGLDPNEILIAEFEYISQTAFQANEDRGRVSSYYLITAGAAVAAILGAQLEGTTPVGVYWGFALVFGVLSAVGLLTLLQLVRLRIAWTASARAMNQIKDYYRTRCPEAQLDQAFAWTTSTIPPPNKRGSIAFLLAMSVIVIDAATAGTAVAYVGLALGSAPGDPAWLIAGGVVGLAFAAAQYAGYHAWLGQGSRS